MSFGPKLEPTITVPPRAEVVGTLTIIPATPGFEVDVFVEDHKGLAVLRLSAKGARPPGPQRPSRPTPAEKSP
jgi:hypothetical protein